MKRKLQILLSYLLVISHSILFLQAQAPMPAVHSGEIQLALKKLQVCGSVLYVAAHPDDENTRMISYLAGEKGYRVTYLSLTRGDGGQNLIGEEKGPLLGMLRTQELLAARRIDGGDQRFSRALDFGYSKTPEEALSIWDKDKILADVIWTIRKVQPDIIITRFARPLRGGGGHGHHTASSLLVEEAVKLSGNPSVLPEQLAYVSTWTPERVLWNTYTWRRYQPSEEDQKILLSMDLDSYNPFLGKGYGEIAAEARSMHRCQAFGTAKRRGEQIESLLHVSGSIPENDALDGINTSWDRVPNSENIAALLKKAYTTFQPQAPEKIIPTLIKAYKVSEGREEFWIQYQKQKVQEIMAYCAGLYFEINSEEPTVANKDSALLTASVIKRTNFPVTLNEIQIKEPAYHFSLNSKEGETTYASADTDSKTIIGQDLSAQAINTGDLLSFEAKLFIDNQPISQPYWLKKQPEKGTYIVDNQELIGLPENPPALEGQFTLTFGEEDPLTLNYQAPVVYKYVDRAIGELYRPFVITPTVTINFQEGVYLFADNSPQDITARIKAHKAQTIADIEFLVPEGWTVKPSKYTVDLSEKGEEQSLALTVTPSTNQSQGKLEAITVVDGQSRSHSLATIAYDHIPTQLVFSPADAAIIKVDLKKAGSRIGYIMGSGDEIPESLRQIGYEVDLLEDEDVTPENLSTYDAIISGIRAYNIRERLPYQYDALMQYIQEGGVYIVQYNTSYSLKTDKIGPYSFSISRDRISNELAELEIQDPSHPVFNYPNKITKVDFEGWIQERGLYFANAWNDKYQALLKGNDPGEDPKFGSLLIAQHGDGYFVYCALSMFRELPKGVPGAYRLFANMISLGKENQ